MLVRDLEMAAFAGRPCGTLSSGQKQRANIARAFLHAPDLLILDEPTTALDVISGQFIVEAIRRERAAGRAVLFSTHIMGEAEYLCDRIYLLHQGRIVDDGTLQDLLARSGQANLTDAFLHHAGRAAGAGEGGAAMRLPLVLAILKKELLETLRDRRTLLLMIGLPVLVYPLLMIVLSRLQEAQDEASQARTSIVAIWGALPAPLAGRMTSRDAQVGLRPWLGAPESVRHAIEGGAAVPRAGSGGTGDEGRAAPRRGRRSTRRRTRLAPPLGHC